MDRIVQTTNSIATRVERATHDIHRSANSITEIATRVDAMVGSMFIFGGSLFIAIVTISGLDILRSLSNRIGWPFRRQLQLQRQHQHQHQFGDESDSTSIENDHNNLQLLRQKSHRISSSVINALFSKVPHFEPPGPLTPDAQRLHRITDLIRDATIATTATTATVAAGNSGIQSSHSPSLPFVRLHIVQAPRCSGITTLLRQALNALDTALSSTTIPTSSSTTTTTTETTTQRRRRSSSTIAAQISTQFPFVYVDLKTWCTGQTIRDCSDLDEYLIADLEEFQKSNPALFPVVILDSLVCLFSHDKNSCTEEHVLRQLITHITRNASVFLVSTDEIVTARCLAWFASQALVHRFNFIDAPDPVWLRQLLTANTSGALINLKSDQLDAIVSSVITTFGGDFGEIFKWFERCKRVSPKEAFDLARNEASMKLRSVLFPELPQTEERIRMGMCLWDIATRLSNGHAEFDFDPEVVASLASRGIVVIRPDMTLKLAKPLFMDLMEEWLFRADNISRIEEHKRFLESHSTAVPRPNNLTPLGSDNESAT